MSIWYHIEPYNLFLINQLESKHDSSFQTQLKIDYAMYARLIWSKIGQEYIIVRKKWILHSLKIGLNSVKAHTNNIFHITRKHRKKFKWVFAHLDSKSNIIQAEYQSYIKSGVKWNVPVSQQEHCTAWTMQAKWRDVQDTHC
jgi:hypothetical protein